LQLSLYQVITATKPDFILLKINCDRDSVVAKVLDELASIEAGEHN
jgi:hypothetical protein